jgi:hypothetical protein
MASGAGIDISGFEKKLDTYINNVKAKLRAEWNTILDKCLLDIESRTPPPEVEFSYIQGIAGGQFMGGGPNKDGKAHDGADIRQSFIRAPGMWIKDLVMEPATWEVNTENFTMSLGKYSALEALSKFSWINYSKSQGSMPHISNYGVFSFFEYGKSSVQVAIFASSRGRYKLKPNEYESYWLSSKHYPAFRMYSGFNKQLFKDAVMAVARTVKYGEP